MECVEVFILTGSQQSFCPNVKRYDLLVSNDRSNNRLHDNNTLYPVITVMPHYQYRIIQNKIIEICELGC